MSDKKILGLYYDEIHPVHEAWFNEVGDLKGFDIDLDQNPVSKLLKYVWNARKIPNGYDVLLCESKIPLRTAFVYKIFNPGTEIVLLVADQNLYECVEKGKNDLEEKITHRFVDGAIAVSEFVKNYAENYLNCDIEIVHPFVSDLEKYLGIEQDYSEPQKVLFVGKNYPNKNVKALREAIKSLDDLELILVGESHEESDHERIDVRGYVDDLISVYEEADIYVQPSDGDAFPVASLEAMAAGLPTIVTEKCGTNSLYLEDSKIISKPGFESISSKINNLCEEMSSQERAKLAQRLRDNVKELGKDKSIDAFDEAIGEVIR